MYSIKQGRLKVTIFFFLYTIASLYQNVSSNERFKTNSKIDLKK